jgi:hypothetical protein
MVLIIDILILSKKLRYTSINKKSAARHPPTALTAYDYLTNPYLINLRCHAKKDCSV